MSYSRLNYDKDAYVLNVDRSVGPGDYRLRKYFAENDDICFSYDGPIGNKGDVSLVNRQQYNEAVVDAESDLSWRSKLLTKSNENTNPFIKHKTINKINCGKELVKEDTRFTHPIDNYRCMSLTAYQYEPYLFVNPQCHVQESHDRLGLNSRLHCKDTYVLPVQDFWDNGSSLPTPSKDEPGINCYCVNKM